MNLVSITIIWQGHTYARRGGGTGLSASVVPCVAMLTFLSNGSLEPLYLRTSTLSLSITLSLPSPWPLDPGTLLLCAVGVSFLYIRHRGKAMRHLLFRDWLTHWGQGTPGLSMLSQLRVFPPLQGWVLFLWMSRLFVIHVSISRHLGCFPVLTAGNGTAVNTQNRWDTPEEWCLPLIRYHWCTWWAFG